jgi:hypothetical protein
MIAVMKKATMQSNQTQITISGSVSMILIPKNAVTGARQAQGT